MVGYHQSEAALPWTGKCICIHVIVVSSSSLSAACSSVFLFLAAWQGLGLVLGEKQALNVKLDLYPVPESTSLIYDEITTATALRD